VARLYLLCHKCKISWNAPLFAVGRHCWVFLARLRLCCSRLRRSNSRLISEIFSKRYSRDSSQSRRGLGERSRPELPASGPP
jgi:hypothetical protein